MGAIVYLTTKKMEEKLTQIPEIQSPNVWNMTNSSFHIPYEGPDKSISSINVELTLISKSNMLKFKQVFERVILNRGM